MRSDSSTRAVSMMMGIAAVFLSDRTVRQISRPSTCGSIRSRTTRSGGNCRQRVAARHDVLGREPGFVEIVGDERCDVRIVLDDEDAGRHPRPFYWRGIRLSRIEVSPTVTFP